MTETTLAPEPLAMGAHDDDFDHLTREGMTTTLCGKPNRWPMSDEPRFGSVCAVCRAVAYSTGVTWDTKGRPI